MMLTAVSLFTGCGGSDLGLSEAGYEIIFANDVNQYAKDFYEANLPETHYVLGDVRSIASFPKADLLVGCYPCQGFSEGGVREASRSINYLYREFDRALRIVRPKAFVVENVSGMTRSNNKGLLRNQITRFRMAGYRVSFQVLDAWEFGVPQKRKRIFLVGTRSDLEASFTFPKAPALEETRLKPSKTIKEALSGLPHWPDASTYDRQPFHWYYMSRNRRKDWDDPAPTIVANSRHSALHPISPEMTRLGPDRWIFSSDQPARRYSYYECALLQGFPRSIIFPETRGIRDRYKAVGNAVPPPVFHAVASALRPIVS